jgi:hypothetical protein
MTADVSFSLPYEKLSYILKSAALLDLDEVAFQIEGGYVTLYAEKENLQGSLATVNLGLSENVSEKIKVVVKKDRLKFFNSDYEVDISLKGAIRFRSDFITYIIAVEKNKSVGLK